MQADFWLESWDVGGTKTSFHRNDIHPYAITYASPEFLKGKRVLVPLCGKDNVLMWLREHADHVIGIELAEKAIEQFLQIHNLPYHKTADQRYEADRLTLINRDIFDLQAADLGHIDFVYDRAALVALPEDMREQYRHKIDEFMPIGSQCLVVTLEFLPYLGNMPPFSITPEEMDCYYRNNYFIDHVEQLEQPEHRMVSKFGLSFLKEHAFMLTKVSDRSSQSWNLGDQYRNKTANPFLSSCRTVLNKAALLFSQK
ncbi:MAG TPA: hypothetical protein V6C78_05905 [Crinalium sp.]|jgi:thiopurine S-methyltransferase